MQLLLQTDGGFSDWIEILIILLVVGGSTIASVGKWFISKLNPEAAENKRKAAMEKSGRPMRRGLPPPARPVARPLPPREERHEGPQRPVAPPLPPLREIIAEEMPPPTPVTRYDDAPARPRVPQRPKRAPAPAPMRPRSSTKAQRRVVPPPEARQERVEKRHLKSSFEVDEDRKFVERAAKLGKLTHAPATADSAPASGEFDDIRRPSRKDLRKAIIMNEILGPPVSLRPPEQRF